MNLRHWLTTLTSASLIAAAATSAQAQPARQYPLRDFFKNPAGVISPVAGRQDAWLHAAP